MTNASTTLKYAVGIPTRQRTDILYKTVSAFVDQLVPPELILIVDNNDEPSPLSQDTLRSMQNEKTKIETVRCDYPTPGIIHGDQTALRIFTEREYEIAARWDDDLAPTIPCMEKLLRLLNGNYVGAGGMYPGPGGYTPQKEGGFSRLRDDEAVGANGQSRHLQFYIWADAHRIVDRHFLYSSFMYRVEEANRVGGFCTRYSRHSFRADTDFTLRLATVGRLAVDTSAVATHWWEPGGIRGISEQDRMKMKRHDISLFERRMKELGINPNY